MDWDYTEIKPEGPLSKIIDCIWWENYVETHPQNKKHLLVPDNSIELIFTNSNIVRFFPLTKENKVRKSQLAGLRTIPQHCTVSKSPIINVRFIPKAFYLLSKTEIIHTINNNLDPVECFGQSILDLEKDIFMASSQQDRIHLIESYFEEYLDSQSNYSDETFEKIANHIDSCKGECAIREFPAMFHISVSTIERKFKKNLGLTPKKYSMLVRFFYQFLSRGKETRSYGSNIGFSYYDQAHFIKEIRKFSGLTPKQLASYKIGIQEAYSKK